MEVDRIASALIIGDVTLEQYIHGTVSRLAEASTPVVEQKLAELFPGGAASIARGLAALRMRVFLVGMIGSDQAGTFTWNQMNQCGIDISGLLVVPGRRTAMRTDFIGNGQRLLTLNAEAPPPLSTMIENELIQLARQSLHAVDSIVLADYGMGTFNSTLAERIISLAKQDNKRVIVTTKDSRSLARFSDATLLASDMQMLAAAELNLPPSPLTTGIEARMDAVARILLGRNKLDALVVMHKSLGQSLYVTNNKIIIPKTGHVLKDIRGASDSFTAGLIWGLSTGQSILQAVHTGSLARGIAASQLGVPAISLDELMAGWEQVKEWQDKAKTGTLGKILNTVQLTEKIRFAKTTNLKIVFTSGCFDILHMGHIDLLQKAKSFGHRLVVGIRSDASIQRLKGASRPIVQETRRAQLLSALACVDYVVIFNEDDALHLVQAIHPDVLVLSAADQEAEIAEQRLVEAQGGRVEVIPMTEGLSTTALVNSIIERHRS
ncbi:hypothetical protein N7457_000548 [Penicillium paradoxum]|uniref:uncharacterized protein n=1 Tax=Penicillium paradoxum TaxID=176176 RepID=UPI002548ECCD|nr:uncharacterized protein N7457_000548 [Penicillium paradoxum]KAJ5793949.1 hypothetical protein N7457_000548 [Penicillium paradoxum]